MKDKWSSEWKEREQEQDSSSAAASSSTAVAQDAIAHAATLTNRKTKETSDSSLERQHVISSEESQLDPSAPAFEPSQPLKDESLLVKESSVPVQAADSSKIQGDKLSNSNEMLKEGGDFQGERSGRTVEPIQ